MIRLLSRFLIREPEAYSNPETRTAYGVLTGFVGVGFNILLFALKFLAGTLSGSIAITADAFNNLSDAGSSVVTLLGFRLASKKPDKDHPYGHGRLEYVSGLIVSMIIVMMGFELLKSAVEKILHPEQVEFRLLTVVILVISILVKMYMFVYNRSYGRKIDSSAMKATATDSLSDCGATGAVLLATLLGHYLNWKVDGWCGLIVSGLVLYAGIRAAIDTISPLLGQAEDPEFVREVQKIVERHQEVVGIHDMMVHDYGPGRVMLTLHAEVPADGDILLLHDIIDNIERELQEKLNCSATIHMDPIMTSDPYTADLKNHIREEIRKTGENISIHDFRIVRGPSHTNVLFDAVLPFESKKSPAEAEILIREIVRNSGEHLYPIVTIDRPYVK